MATIDHVVKRDGGCCCQVECGVAGDHRRGLTDAKTLSVIVVPWHPHEICEGERIALMSIRRFAQGAELVVVTPDASSIPPLISPDRIEVFQSDYFKDIYVNNRLMTSVSFYERFERYQQMILVHCDALLLKPLAPILEKPYPWSYVGAPWVGRRGDGSLVLEGVGNGGFSVRRIPDFLDVLRRSSFPSIPRYTKIRNGVSLWAFLAGCFLTRVRGERIAHMMIDRDIMEDIFWAKVAPCLSSRFTVAPLREAMAFSYELYPKFVHDENHGAFPYGIHAWWKYDADFVRQLASI